MSVSVPQSVSIPEGSSSSLRALDIKVHFNGVHALDKIGLSLEPAECLGLIGPNGAGKTTLVNVLTGFQKPTEGSVWLRENEVTSWSAAKRSRAGMARSFQAVRLFTRLSVRENIELGALGTGASAGEASDRAEELIEEADFHKWADSEARSLPHGIAHRAGILRALSGGPEFLLLDEPAAGLHESDTDELGKFLREVREKYRCGILLIEHDVRFVMSMCDRVQVLNYGRCIAIGTPDEVSADPLVHDAYMGTAE